MRGEHSTLYSLYETEICPRIESELAKSYDITTVRRNCLLCIIFLSFYIL